LETTLKAEQQSILFLNRRGFSPSVRCSSCGHLLSCPDCSVAMTFHKGRHSDLRCHYCDRRTQMPTTCEACKSTALVLEGLGTEKLEESIAEAFPTARVARLDRDVAHSGDDVEAIMGRMRRREIDILVGTQMVTKGHDLPDVTLVGVVNADAAISIPDFRSAERAFQLLVQVAGRAGRAEKRGRVLVQTYTPAHHAITLAAEHDVDGFIERELEDRRELFYPPFSRAVLLRVDAVDEHAAKSVAMNLADVARAEIENRKSRVDVVGPAPAPIARIRGRFRFRVMLRSADRQELRAAITAILRAAEGVSSSIGVQIDVDPVQLL
jgi:primosomal protein N' (replication factor Y) (superfamily II helicase)